METMAMKPIDLTSQPSEDSMDVMFTSDVTIQDDAEQIYDDCGDLTEHDCDDEANDDTHEIKDDRSSQENGKVIKKSRIRKKEAKEIQQMALSVDADAEEQDSTYGHISDEEAEADDEYSDYGYSSGGDADDDSGPYDEEDEDEDEDEADYTSKDSRDFDESLIDQNRADELTDDVAAEVFDAVEGDKVKPISMNTTVANDTKQDPEPSYSTCDDIELQVAEVKDVEESMHPEALPDNLKAEVTGLTSASPPPPPPYPVSRNSDNTPSSPVVHSKGLEFNMAEPWQRSLLRELERKEMEGKPLSPRTKPSMQPLKQGRMMVGHTESRDYAIDMCDSATFSLMTDTSSVVQPTQPQLIHRNRAYRDEDIFVDDEVPDRYEHPTPKTVDRKGAPGHGSPRSIYDEMRQATRGNDRSPYSDQWLEIEHSDMGENYARYNDFNDDATAVTFGTAEGQQEACYCLGYNVMDMILPPQRPTKSRNLRSHRRLHVPPTRLAKVQEDSNEQDYNGTSRDSFSRKYMRQDTPESRSGKESGYRSRPIRQTQSRDPDGAYLDQS